MDILFVIDRLELKYFEFNNLVTNFWIIRELLNENKNVFITTIDKLGMSKGIPFAHCYLLSVDYRLYRALHFFVATCLFTLLAYHQL